MSSLPDLEIPGYDILEAIGRGGMASVYRARQHTFDRNVALKILKPDLSEDDAFCQRFVMESLIVAKLNHSNIVQVYDVGEIKNHYYIAMEFLSGGDLHKRLKEGLSEGEAVSIIKQIASALDFAHRKKIIHRDLKPDNVMFREDEAAVLTDFGIAKETDADVNLTKTGLIVGTPKYMAPEQIRGSAPTPQADIYSLGIMFFQLLCNRVPFHGADLMATAYQHFNEPVPQLPPHLSQYQELIEHMLAKKTEDRIPCGKDVVKALERIEKAHPISEAPDETVILQTSAQNNEDATVVHSADLETVVTQAQHPNVAASAPTMINTDHPPTQAVSRTPENTPPPIEEREATSVRSTPFNKPVIFGGLALAGALLIGGGVFLTQPKNSTPTLPKVSEQTQSQITELLLGAITDIQNKRLSVGESNALSKYEKILILSPNHPQALAGKKRVAKEYLALARNEIAAKNFSRAQEYVSKAKDIDTQLDISHVQTQLDAAQRNQRNPISTLKKVQISGLLENAQIYEKEGQLFSPPGENAAENYKKILELDPYNAEAKRKLTTLEAR